MSDRLENFIRNHKKEFEGFEPPQDLWAKIEKGLPRQSQQQLAASPKSTLAFFVGIAAVLAITLSIGIVLWQYREKGADISNIDPQLARQEIHYASLIEEKRNEIKRIEKENPQLYREFASEITTMDDDYQKLKNDLPGSPNQEKTVKAMIRNLQIQIQVLNQQLRVIEQVNQLKKEHQHETESI